MFRNWFSNRPAVSPRHGTRSAAPRRTDLNLERLEDRTVPTTFAWNGSTSSDFTNMLNWTPNGVPGAGDSILINGGPNATVVNSATVASITMGNGALTVNGTLTDTGGFNQSQGFVGFGAGGQLQIGGDVIRIGGVFFGSQGTVVLNGTVGQNLNDTSNHPVQNLTISNGSVAGVTVPTGTNPGVSGNATLNAGSNLTLAGTATLSVGGGFSDSGKIFLTQLTANGGAGSAPLKVTGTLTVVAGTAFDLTVGSPASGNVYTFASYGSLSGTTANFTVHGNGAFIATPNLGANALTVTTLSTAGIIDTWTGAVSNNWFTAGNWSANAVPGTADTAVLKAGTANATVIDSANGASPTIAALQVSGGFLTIQGTDNLTVTGNYSQDAGFLAFAANANTLFIGGNVLQQGGVFLGTTGTVNLNGTAAQSITDTSTHPLGWNAVISNTSAAVTVQAGSTFAVGNNLTVNSGATLTVASGAVVNVNNTSNGITKNFTNNGTVNLSMATQASATPLVIGNNLNEGVGSFFHLFIGSLTAGQTYNFITFGGTDSPLNSTVDAPNGGTVHHTGASPITVTTLSTAGIIDTWTGAVSNNWFTAGNWSANAVPGTADTAVLKAGTANATVIDSANGASPTIAALQVSGGFLTIQGTDNLTVTGNYSQDAGFLAFAANANTLFIGGNVLQQGGVFLGTTGTVNLNGTAAQSITDTSTHPLGWNAVISNTSAAVTVQAGSTFAVGNNLTVNSGATLTVASGAVVNVNNTSNGITKNFTNNGTVNLSMATQASATPLVIGNNLNEGVGSFFHLFIGSLTAGQTYNFITFGGTDSPLNSTVDAPNGGTVHHTGASPITVTT